MKKVNAFTSRTRLCQLVPRHHQMSLHFVLGTNMYIIDDGRGIDISCILYLLILDLITNKNHIKSNIC
jgi:hypothetical protein